MIFFIAKMDQVERILTKINNLTQGWRHNAKSIPNEKYDEIFNEIMPLDLDENQFCKLFHALTVKRLCLEKLLNFIWKKAFLKNKLRFRIVHVLKYGLLTRYSVKELYETHPALVNRMKLSIEDVNYRIFDLHSLVTFVINKEKYNVKKLYRTIIHKNIYYDVVQFFTDDELLKMSKFIQQNEYNYLLAVHRGVVPFQRDIFFKYYHYTFYYPIKFDGEIFEFFGDEIENNIKFTEKSHAIMQNMARRIQFSSEFERYEVIMKNKQFYQTFYLLDNVSNVKLYKENKLKFNPKYHSWIDGKHPEQVERVNVRLCLYRKKIPLELIQYIIKFIGFINWGTLSAEF